MGSPKKMTRMRHGKPPSAGRSPYPREAQSFRAKVAMIAHESLHVEDAPEKGQCAKCELQELLSQQPKD